jgi:two-component system sensor histidine kinase YesM
LRQMSKTDSISNIELYQASQNITASCQSVMYNHSDIQSIYVFSLNGGVFGHSRTVSEGISSTYDPTEEDWYQETLDLNGSLYISPIGNYSMFNSDKDCFFVSQLIRDVDKDFRSMGVLVIAYSPEIFDLSPENTIGDLSLVTLTNLTDHSILYTNASDGESNLTATDQNSTIDTVYRTPFELSLIIDYDSLARDYKHTLYLLVVLAILCLFISFLVIVYFIRNFITPIEELSNGMEQKQLDAGGLSSPYENRKDEIGVLYRQYDQMIQKINASIKTDYQNKLIVLDAQMQSLEARINSHFLFNTLESINSMAELADADEISTMSLALGNMFRYAIKTDRELVTLEEELQHVMDYNSIQSIRFSGRYQLTIDVPKELRSLKILKLILQPIVENSLAHGLDYCRHGDQIKISAYVEDATIFLSVADNGIGMYPEELEKLLQSLHQGLGFTELGKRSKQGIGLKNIQTRIELYYGQGFGLHIESSHLQGTTITVKIPYLEEDV